MRLFILLFLVSCASNNNTAIKPENEPVIYETGSTLK